MTEFVGRVESPHELQALAMKSAGAFANLHPAWLDSSPLSAAEQAEVDKIVGNHDCELLRIFADLKVRSRRWARYRVEHVGGQAAGPCSTKILGGYCKVVADPNGTYTRDDAVKIAETWNQSWAPDKLPAPIEKGSQQNNQNRGAN